MVAAIAEPSASIGLLNYPECTFATTGLLIPPGMPFDRWEQLGADLRRAAKGIQFWIGDWIRYGEHEYGDRYSQAIAATDRDKQTLMNYVYVAEHVEISRRRENVDFSIHAEVASLPPKEQEKILSRAAADPDTVTVKQVRKDARRIKRKLRQIPDEVDLIHIAEVQGFLSDYVKVLQTLDDHVPASAAFLRNMIQAHIGQVQWQKDRTVEADCAVIMEAVEETLGPDDEIFMWLINRGYFMSDPDLDERLELMCANKQIYAVKQGGRKDTQRGDMVTVYHPQYESTGDAVSVARGRSIYEMGERE